jgi:hypothetical protein
LATSTVLSPSGTASAPPAQSRSANQPVTALDVPYVLLKPRRGQFATQILLHRRANGVNVQLLAKQIV